MPKNQDALIQDVVARLQTGNQETIRKIVEEVLESRVADGQRDLTFGQAAEPKLAGSKFARWNLSIGDVEFMYDLQRALHNSAPSHFRGPSEELENAFNALSEAQYFSPDKVRAIDKQALDNVFPRIPLSSFRGRDLDYALRGEFEKTSAYRRAMDTQEAGYGAELVGAQYVGEMWAAARRKSRVFALLPTFEMTAPLAYLPVEADLPEMLYVGESTSYPGTEFPTTKTGSRRVEVNARKFVMHQIWTGEMEEDSILPFVPMLRSQAVVGLSHYSDSLVLNGDVVTAATGNINSHDAAPSAYKHYLGFDGLRKVGLVDNTANQLDLGGPVTWAALNSATTRMIDYTYLQDWGHPVDASDIIQVVDPATGDQIALLDEVIKWRTAKGTPLINGQIADVSGRPVVSSIAMPRTDANGMVSATLANNVKGSILTFNKRGTVIGWRRRVTMEVERMPATDQMRIVYSLRLGMGRFSPNSSPSGIESADIVFNIT